MPDTQANLEPIARFRNALAGYAHSQADALESANAEVRAVLSDLDETRAHWRYQVELRTAQAEECQREAMYAAQEGGSVDCSPIYHALEEAQDKLARVINAQYRFEQAVEAYQRVHQHLAARVLELDVPRAVAYLDAVLQGLDAYLQVPLRGESTATPSLPDKTYLPDKPPPGPVTPAEWKEGSVGGAERRG